MKVVTVLRPDNMTPGKDHRETSHERQTPLPTPNIRSIGIQLLRHTRRSFGERPSIKGLKSSSKPDHHHPQVEIFLQCEHFYGDASRRPPPQGKRRSPRVKTPVHHLLRDARPETQAGDE
ncbi:hypothetical protein Rs2_42880 [Raphanus sativus]|nr:hypothetical protein Rs2_42880 [Raphanus sativus]